MRLRDRQGGIALLMVLVIVALGTLLAAELVRQQQLQTRRSSNMLHGDQAFQYALGGEAWAKGVLLSDAEGNAYDSFKDFWNRGLPPTPIPGGTISGRLRELQGRFNLNEVHDGKQPNQLAEERLKRLLSSLDLSQELYDFLHDWLDEDSQVRLPGGAEDDYYSRLSEPYRAANGPLMDITELYLLRGVDQETYAKLASEVVVLPGETAINVNTATSQVLQSLGLSQAEAETVIAAREQEVFESIQAFTELQVIKGKTDFDSGKLSVSSRFFELESEVVMGDTRFVQYSLLLRDGKNSVTVLSRRRRGW